MSRKIWLVLAIVASLTASFAASVVAVKRAKDPRTKYTTHALDYLHSRQTESGGFSTPENTAWAILGMIAKQERQGSSAWRVKGKSPFTYLQSADLAAGASNGVENAPVYYSRLIMAYVASRNSNQVATAGSKGINLLTELWKYQDMSDTSANKGAFAALPGTMNSAIHSTSWAILAMYSVEDDPASRSALHGRPGVAGITAERRTGRGQRLLQQRDRAAGQRGRHGAGDPGAHRRHPAGSLGPRSRQGVPRDASERRRRLLLRQPGAAAPRPMRPARPSRRSSRWERTPGTGARRTGTRTRR